MGNPSDDAKAEQEQPKLQKELGQGRIYERCAYLHYAIIAGPTLRRHVTREESHRNQKLSSDNSMMSPVVASAIARSAVSSGNRFRANQEAVATLPS